MNEPEALAMRREKMTVERRAYWFNLQEHGGWLTARLAKLMSKHMCDCEHPGLPRHGLSLEDISDYCTVSEIEELRARYRKICEDVPPHQMCRIDISIGKDYCIGIDYNDISQTQREP